MAPIPAQLGRRERILRPVLRFELSESGIRHGSDFLACCATKAAASLLVRKSVGAILHKDRYRVN